MTKEEFFRKLETHRSTADRLIEGDGGYKIQRGMAHGISGYVEDLFALFIAKNIKSIDLDYYVDKVTSIRFNQNEKAKSFKPDLSIIDDNVLTHYFDLKTNMGWNRNFAEYLRDKNNFIEKIKGKKAWIKWPNWQQDIIVSADLKYQMVIVYGWNINQDLLKENIKKAGDYPNIEVHVLYEKKDDGYNLNKTAFDEILKAVKR